MSAMNRDRGALTPEGQLIEAARERAGFSQNEAARAAGMSGTRWRQIVERDASSMRSPRGLKTLARMAETVELSREQMAAIGRHDVADRMPGEATTEEMADEVLRRIDELQAVMDRELGQRNRPVRDALFGALRADVEGSTTDQPGR